MLKSKLLIGTSLVLLGSINAVNAGPINDCHMRVCTSEEKIAANEYYIDIVGQAAVNNLQSIIEIEDDIKTNTEDIANLEAALESEIDGLKSGVAMAIAVANAPVISNGANKFSLSGGLGYYEETFALSLKGAYLPTNSVAITGSVATDLEDNYSFGAGVGMAF